MANSAVRFRSVLLGLMMVATVHGRERSDAVDLADVRALTFRRGQMTASRRVAAVPQVPLFAPAAGRCCTQRLCWHLRGHKRTRPWHVCALNAQCVCAVDGCMAPYAAPSLRGCADL